MKIEVWVKYRNEPYVYDEAKISLGEDVVSIITKTKTYVHPMQCVRVIITEE